MGVASHPRGAGGSPLFYISTSFTDCTTELYTDAPNSLLATLAHSTSSTGAFNLLKFVLSHEEEEEEEEEDMH